MIATLQFELENERQAFEDAIQGVLWRQALTELIDSIERSLTEDGMSLPRAETLEFVQHGIAELMRERGIATR